MRREYGIALLAVLLRWGAGSLLLCFQRQSSIYACNRASAARCARRPACFPCVACSQACPLLFPCALVPTEARRWPAFRMWRILP